MFCRTFLGNPKSPIFTMVRISSNSSIRLIILHGELNIEHETLNTQNQMNMNVYDILNFRNPNSFSSIQLNPCK